MRVDVIDILWLYLRVFQGFFQGAHGTLHGRVGNVFSIRGKAIPNDFAQDGGTNGTMPFPETLKISIFRCKKKKLGLSDEMVLEKAHF